MAKRKRKSFKFNDTVKTTSGQPLVGAIWEIDQFTETAEVISFRTGKKWVIPFKILKKISAKQSDSDYSRLYHKLG